MGTTKHEYCERGRVSQGRCRRKVAERVEIGLKTGPLPVCRKCAAYLLETMPNTARRVGVAE